VIRQWTKLKNRRLEYLKTLTEALYFRTLGAGPGVFHTLLWSAEQQEVAEVLLAYRFLLASSGGLTVSELDTEVETWLRDDGHGDIDFEVADAVAKLRRLEVIEGDITIQALSLHESLVLLDRRWDDLFRYRPAESEAPSSSRDRSVAAVDRFPRLIRLRRVIDRYRGRVGERRTRREADFYAHTNGGDERG
jgi:hypothetical protein